MAKTFKRPTKIKNIDPEACKVLFDGRPTEDGGCEAMLEIDTENPKTAHIGSLDEDILGSK